MLKSAFSEHDLNPERVDWRVAETPIDVVRKAIVAISFNSTVLYQLLSLNVPLIIPFVYASEQEKDDAILHNSKGMDEAGIFRVDTMQELDVVLNRIIANHQNFDFTHQFRLSLRESYLSWDPANPSARRVEETILLLNNRRSKNSVNPE